MLTSAPETRNGRKLVFKKRREVGRGSWEGELGGREGGGQEAYLKDVSCIIT